MAAQMRGTGSGSNGAAPRDQILSLCQEDIMPHVKTDDGINLYYEMASTSTMK
jgi:hypothetical protein